MNETLLEINNLSVEFKVNGRVFTAVDGVNFRAGRDEVVVVAGESGSGKTVTAFSIARLLPPAARVKSGSILFDATDMLSCDAAALTAIRGKRIAYIFQEPAAYLNPVFSIGDQIMEAVITHTAVSRARAYAAAAGLLNSVKITDPRRVMASYPHQLSGGMNQRVFLAMALACAPELLIADEPTTSLDVTIEAEILDVLLELKKQRRFSLVFITHNLAIARRIADRICVMHRGKVVEEGPVERIFTAPRHAHTRELIQAYERIGKL